MKYFQVSVVIIIFVISNASAQNNIALTFTAGINGIHRPLDSVRIQNLTQGVDTVLYGNDTVLIIEKSIGIPEFPRGVAKLPFEITSFPNPFDYNTTLHISIPVDERITIRAFNLSGQELKSLSLLLKAGEHTFSFFPGNQKQCLVSIENTRHKQAIKLINIGHGVGDCRFEHTGWFPHTTVRNAQTSIFLWDPGDEMLFFGFASIDSFIYGHDIIDDNPLQSSVYSFDLLTGLPCMVQPFVTDIDGNLYRTVRIGNQCWLRENLKSTRYDNGNLIPLVTDSNAWITLATPGYCWYENDSATYGSKYGALYNWYAVSGSSICPAGWHLPSDAEWQVMEMNLGMTSQQASLTGFRGTDEGGKMKESGFESWQSPNLGATNSSGFTALPAGKRSDGGGAFSGAGGYAYWWTASDYASSFIWYRIISYDSSQVNRVYHNKEHGYSVRCVRSTGR